MARGFAEDFLEELKQRNNIVSVISRYISLEKKGRSYWGRCPFHLEKTPSFSVNEVDQYYHCFGCKAGGNIFKFIMDMESVSFFDAVRMIAEWSGVPLPQLEGDQESFEKQKKERAIMHECMKECAKHYHENLEKSEIAQEYLTKRGITKDMITKFGIGYSCGYTEIIDYLEGKGYHKDLLYKVGIIKEKEGRFYDAIGERIAFPIIDIYGNVVAFSGRTMKAKVDFAKYINTGDTPIFSKSKNLFGINLVKKAKQQGLLKEIIIVEGQTDVIALHKAGFVGTVASLGTALTVEQARLIKRLAEKVVICYDGDFAGVKATLRGLDILKNESLNVRVASLPDGKDPDEVLRESGAGVLTRILNAAIPLTEYKLKKLKEQYDITEFDGKAKYVDAAIDVLTDLSEVEAEVYIDLISGISGVYKDFLRKKLKDKNLILSENNTVRRCPVTREEVVDDNLAMAEVCVLSNIFRKMNYVNQADKVAGLISNRYAEIKDDIMSGENAAYLTSKYEQDEDIIGEIINFNFSEDDTVNKTQYEDCLWLIYKNNLLTRQAVLTSQLSGASQEKRREIMTELMSISQKINSKKVEL